MHRIETVEEIHSILLDIGKEFHRICVKHEIPYYMLGGTQLGAIRHKGFIPWDDDMDFGIPREYYKIFQEVAAKELPPQYKLLTIDNSKRIMSDLSKIELRTTIIKEKDINDRQKQIGVFIDVFPLDKTNGNLSPFSKNRIIRYIIDIFGYRFLSFNNRSFPKKLIALFVKMIFAPITPKILDNYVKKHLITNEGDFIANHYGAWKTKEIMPKEIFGEPTLYKFEDSEFYGVKDYEQYLTRLYGTWRQMPSEDKRHVHVLEVYFR